MASASESQPAGDEGAGPSPTARSILSLLIFIHLFCVLVVLGSTFRRSALQSRLVAIFGPYTQVLALDPGFYTPYFYTQGRTSDDDATIVLDLYADANRPVEQQAKLNTVVFPGGGSPWLDDRRRAFSLARLMAGYAEPDAEVDELTGEIARGLGARILREHSAKRAVVRCVRRLSQPLDLTTLLAGFPPGEPTAAAYDEMLYEADVWIDEDGEVQVQRRVAQAEAAPRRTSPAGRPRGQEPGAGDRESGVGGRGS